MSFRKNIDQRIKNATMEQKPQPKKRSIAKTIGVALLFIFTSCLVLCGFALAIPAMIWKVAMETGDNISDSVSNYFDDGK